MTAINTGNMSGERTEELIRLRGKLDGMKSQDFVNALKLIPDNQTRYDLCRILNFYSNGLSGFIHTMMSKRAAEPGLVIEALSLLDAGPDVNVYDEALVTLVPSSGHTLFDLIRSRSHSVNPSMCDYLCSKMSRLDVEHQNYSLLSYALSKRHYWFVRVLMNHPFDMTKKDGWGFSGDDYINHQHNPDNYQGEGAAFIIDDDFLLEWQAMTIAKDFRESGLGQPKLSRRAL